MENKIKISSFDDGLVIKISGELDSYKTMIYKDKICLSIATKKPHLLLFDLKELTFLDSAGIGLILGRYNEIKKINEELSDKNEKLEEAYLSTIQTLRYTVEVKTHILEVILTVFLSILY